MQNHPWSPKWFENITRVHLCHSLLSSKLTKTVHYTTPSPLYIYCVQCIFYIWSFWFRHQQLCELPVHGVLKVTEPRLYSDHRETQHYLQLASSSKWHNVQHFLKLSSTMFNVYRVINEVVFPLNVSIILMNQPYNTCYSNCLTSWTVYIKSCSQHIFTFPLYEEYHHQHHHIPPLSPRSQAVGLLCSSPFWLFTPELKVFKFCPVSAPTSEICSYN